MLNWKKQVDQQEEGALQIQAPEMTLSWRLQPALQKHTQGLNLNWQKSAHLQESSSGPGQPPQHQEQDPWAHPGKLVYV